MQYNKEATSSFDNNQGQSESQLHTYTDTFYTISSRPGSTNNLTEQQSKKKEPT